MRQAVRELIALGPFPPMKDAPDHLFDTYTHLLHSIERPVTDEEAAALVPLFGHDTFFGLAWRLFHTIETAPGWPLMDVLQDTENEWVARLRRRVTEGIRPMRQAVYDLMALGPFPPETPGDADETFLYPDELLDTYDNLLLSLEHPVTDEEARALVTLFGPDTFYGVAWTLLHTIETAPGWPLMDVLQDTENEWVARLRQRSENADLM